MDFSLDDGQVALRDAVRRYCEGSYPTHERGNTESAKQAAARWAGLAELGVLAMPLDTRWGGGGLGAAEVMLASQEFGRVLGGQGFVPSVVLAGSLLAAAAEPLQDRWLPALAEGRARIGYAAGEAEMRGDFTRAGVAAERLAEGFMLNGSKAFVLEAAEPGLVLLLARTSSTDGESDGLTLFAVETTSPGVSLTAYHALDGRRAAQLRLDQVAVPAAAVVGRVGGGYELAAAAVDRALAAWCGEAAGAIEALFDLTLEYVNTRRQFGAPLAKFQVLQHRLADVLMSLELSRSMACAAATAVDEAEAGERRRIVSAAKAFIGRAGREAGHCAVQLHGGMGMTDECRVGHYVKRLMVLDQYFGSASAHLARLAA